MLSRLTFPVVAAIMLAGVSIIPAVASTPTDPAAVAPTLIGAAAVSAAASTSSDLAAAPVVADTNSKHVDSSQSVGDSATLVSPKPVSVDQFELVPNGIPTGLPYALDRARLNSAVFASPSANSIAITGGAEPSSFRLPSMSLTDSRRSRSSDSSDYYHRIRVGSRDDLYGPLSIKRQETVDRIGDIISPGFGRVEFDSGRNHIRIDYLYSRKCKIRGAGICFRMSFW